MLHFYQSNVITILNYAKLHAVDDVQGPLDLEVDARLRLHQTRVAGLLANRHRRLVEEELALVVHEPAPVRARFYLKVAPRPVVHILERRVAPEALEPRSHTILGRNPE